MSISIRMVEKTDAQDLSDLFQDFINTDSNIEEMQKLIETISKDPHYYIPVACDGDKVVGTAMAILCYDLVGECNSFMLIENVVVDPRYQKNQIMNSLEDFGSKNNCNYIILVSESKREGSHEFYETLGYTTDQRGFKMRLYKNKTI
ncbi:putative N-acetyltransferase YhbS [Paenibacillus anaericanus]|uniref:GNAT family N-acetyltransferase n=1 Tax=Paenibacillus anaericanus TaxID=170367 RepID=UPI00277D34AA|nr:GNAT family N-acetyltransferase [Paenibacillus anaericanus]MDQ0088849.1 putative N-acetyltransferase YhbS [Paenibacillus anaericanus]